MSGCAPKEVDERGRPKSRAARWRVIVLLIVHAIIAVHIAHWVTTGSSISPLEPSEAMEFSKRGVVNAGLIFFALTTLSTLILGRFFCGWACHLVALQDLCRWMLGKVGIRPRPLRSRTLAFVPFIAFVYMFLWPFYVRESTPETSYHLTTTDFWATFPPWWGALITFLVCGFVAVYFLGAKGFCTYGCPYGALFGVADRLAPGRIRVTDACEGCGMCTATCSSNVDVKREVAEHKMVVDTGCMKCMDCVSVCPKDALYFGFGKPALTTAKSPRGSKPSIKEEAGLVVVFTATFFAVRGLYGVVPFLLALGVAGCFAGISRLAWTKKRAWRFAAALCAIFVVHSGTVQVYAHRAQSAFSDLQPARESYFVGGTARPLTDDETEAAKRVIENAKRAVAWGFLHDARRELELGWAQILLGEVTEGESRLERVASEARRPTITLLELGNFKRRRGDKLGALAHYEEALEVAPEHPLPKSMVFELVVELAEDDLNEQRPGAAEPRFAYALELSPRSLPVRASLADLMLMRRAPDEAIALMEEGVSLTPEDPAALRILAFVHLSLGQVDEASSVCDRAEALPDPDGETAALRARIEAAR